MIREGAVDVTPYSVCEGFNGVLVFALETSQQFQIGLGWLLLCSFSLSYPFFQVLNFCVSHWPLVIPFNKIHTIHIARTCKLKISSLYNLAPVAQLSSYLPRFFWTFSSILTRYLCGGSKGQVHSSSFTWGATSMRLLDRHQECPFEPWFSIFSQFWVCFWPCWYIISGSARTSRKTNALLFNHVEPLILALNFLR